MTVVLQGGLGNQMFQAAYGLSKGCRRFDVSSFDVDNLRHYELDAYDLNIELVKEPHAERGYWQSEKYFDKELVRKLFSLPKAETPHQNKLWPERLGDIVYKIISAKDSCFIGVRRADYLWPERINYHGVMPASYYSEAIKLLPHKLFDVFVFTDDIEWAKENVPAARNIVDVNGPTEKAWDIWLMSLCKHAIIPNSTFHWWGAYLGADRYGGTVIAPKKWFVDETVNAQCEIVLKRWITI